MMCPHCYKWCNNYVEHITSSCKTSPVPQADQGMEAHWGIMFAIIAFSIVITVIAARANAPNLIGVLCLFPGVSAFCYLFAYVIQQINKGEGL